MVWSYSVDRKCTKVIRRTRARNKAGLLSQIDTHGSGKSESLDDCNFERYPNRVGVLNQERRLI
jgi:hypothetical protein